MIVVHQGKQIPRDGGDDRYAAGTVTSSAQVGRRIRRLRTQRGMSQRELAEPFVSAAYMSLIESGQRTPSAAVMEHFAQRLRVDVEEIVLGRPAGYEAELELALVQARTALREGSIAGAEDAAQRVLEEGQKANLARVVARAQMVLALVEEEKGNLEEALARFDDALESWSTEPPHLRYEAVAGRGRCLYLLGRARQAAYDLESYLLDLGRQGIKDPSAEARVYSILIHIYRGLGMVEHELEAARKAHEYSVEIKEPDELACLKINVASALIEHGDYSDAIEATREAERIYGSLGWPVAKAGSQREQALAESARGNVEAARELLISALSALEGLAEDNPERGYVLNELGRTERLLGLFSEALERLRDARELLPEKDVAELALNAREMGLCLAEDNPKAAEKELRRALALYEEADSPKEISATLLHIARLERGLGRTSKALDTLEQAVQASVGEAK